MEDGDPSPEPLLRHPSSPPSRRTLPGLAVGGATGRRSRSAVVREAAARHLQRRRASWAHSRPVVALDIFWNLCFAAAAAGVLFAAADERPAVPLRLWILGYSAQCVLHAALVCCDFRRRSDETNGGDAEDGLDANRRNGFAKKCESVNTMASFVWWIVGFYWVISSGDLLLRGAPMLYWLTVTFLAFDVFFAVFFLAMAILIGIGLCCFLPCFIVILHFLAGQDGASDADISILSRYRYSDSNVDGQKGEKAGLMVPIPNSSGFPTSEHILLHEDAECCICLASYEDGVELCALPCNHHFHATCIIKWLRMHATCPLCKYDIVKGGGDNDAV